MGKIIAFCGIRCDKCEARKYTIADDDAGRAELAVKWSKLYEADIKPEHINCLGCTVDSDVHIPHWNECEYRVCGAARGVANCAHCSDYPCDKLAGFHQYVPDAKAVLDAERRGLQ